MHTTQSLSPKEHDTAISSSFLSALIIISEEMKSLTEFWSINLNRKYKWLDVKLDERIILNFVFKNKLGEGISWTNSVGSRCYPTAGS